ncbi:hypothetical protein CYMTET_5011, partial [Cymbomonas tetramitiformis]
MNFKKFLVLVHIFALQQSCMSTPSIEDFRTVPRFFEADLDMNGCISPYEYKTLSKAVLRRTRLTYRLLQRSRRQQGKFQRPLQLSAHLAAFTPKLAGNTSRLAARGSLPSPEPKARFELQHEDDVPDSLAVSAALSSDTGSTREQGAEVHANVGRVLTSNCGEDAIPVEECSWLNHTGIEYVLRCNDGTYCNVLEGEGEGEGWACCQYRGKRAQCPLNWPTMCARDGACAFNTDYCCDQTCAASGEGGDRPCYLGCTDAEAFDGGPWKDAQLQSCEDYYILDYCSNTGEYGSGWASNKDGSFASYSVNGVSALEACCTCGGGLYPPPPPPLSPPLPPPSPPQTPFPPPLPVAPPVSLNASAVTIDDGTYAFPHLEGALQDDTVAVINLQTDVALARNLTEINRTLSVYGECEDGGNAVHCQISGSGMYRIFTLAEGAALHLQALELHSGYSQTSGGLLHVALARATLVDCVLRDSEAGESGGAVYAHQSHVACSGCSLIGNVAYFGGAVWAHNGSVLLLDNGTLVEGNSGITDHIVGVDEASTLSVNGSTRVIGNSVKGFGTLCAKSNSILLVEGGSLVEGNSANMGGAVSCTTSRVVVSGGSGLRGNYGKENGGALISSGAWNEILITGGSSITGNYATSHGAGIMLESGGNLTVDGGSAISGNVAGLNGGALYVRLATVSSFQDVAMCDNVAGRSGGGVYALELGASVLISRSLLRNNSAGTMFACADLSYCSGGAVYSQGSLKLMDGSVVEGNSAYLFGGALSAARSSSVVVGNNSIVANNSAAAGGGVYAYGHNLVMVADGSVVERNVAVFNGGGVFAGEQSVVTVEGASYIALNSAFGNGGGLYLNELSSFNISGGSSITGNSANITGMGGGLWLGEGSVAWLEDATVAENEGGQGGGVYAQKDGSVHLVHSLVTGNEATNGGGMYGGWIVHIEVTEGSVVTGNVARNEGGGIVFTHLLAHDSTINDNQGVTG